MGSKLTKTKKRSQEEEKTVSVEKDWTTSTWPRKKKPDLSNFNEEKSGTLGRRGKFRKGSTGTLGNVFKLERKPSFGKRIKTSARNWASSRGLYKGSKNQQEDDSETKPISIILRQEEEEEEDVVIPAVENDAVAASSEIDVGALVKELVTQKLMKSKEKINEAGELNIEVQMEDVPIQANNGNVRNKIFAGFIEIDSNTAITTEVYPAENVSQLVCEEDVTAIELIEPSDEIVIATESVVEEKENSYTEEKIEVIENNEISPVDNVQHSVISLMLSSQGPEVTGEKETLETSIAMQPAFKINEVTAEIQMEKEENTDSATPEISHIEEIEEASTIPKEIKQEDDANQVNIEDICIILEDNLEKGKETDTKGKEEVFIEIIGQVRPEDEIIDDKNNIKEYLDLAEHKEQFDNINDILQGNILTGSNSEDILTKAEQTGEANTTEIVVLSNEEINIEHDKKYCKLNATMEENNSDNAAIKETSDEKEEKKKGYVLEQVLPKLNVHQELKYITEVEEDNSLEIVEEIESFEIDAQVQKVTFEGNVEYFESDDQPPKEGLTQCEEPPVLETVEEMEEPSIEESKSMVMCKNEIPTDWKDESNQKEDTGFKDSLVPVDHDSFFKNKEKEGSIIISTEEAISHIIEIKEIFKEKYIVQDPIDMEQNMLEVYAKVEAAPTEQIVGDIVGTDISQDAKDENMTVEGIKEKKDRVSYEDDIGAQEELVLSEAEEIAQNILNKVFTEVTDSAYFEGDDLKFVMENQEEISEESIETVKQETVDSEVLSLEKEDDSLNEIPTEQDRFHVEVMEKNSKYATDNSHEEENKSEASGVLEELVELVKNTSQDDSSLSKVDDQMNTPNVLELVKEVEEVKQSPVELTASFNINTVSSFEELITVKFNNDNSFVCCNEVIKVVEESEEYCQHQVTKEACQNHADEEEEDRVDEEKKDCENYVDEANEQLNQAMQDLSGKLGNTLKLVQEHILVTSDDIVEMEKSKTTDSEFSTLTNTHIDDEVSEDGSDEERTDVSTDEGIVASSDEDEKCHDNKEAKEKLSKNKEDVKESLDSSISESN